MTATITVIATRDDSVSPGGNPSTPPASAIASANDKGPVAIITEEPSCIKWTEIATQLANRESIGWEKRDSSMPATSWTPDQRREYEAVAAAMRTAADQTIPLVSQTPHRVVREYYAQFVAYAHAYADSIPAYVSEDESLARVAVNSATVMTAICTAIFYGSAESNTAAVAPVDPPSPTELVNDLNKPHKFLTVQDRACREMPSLTNEFNEQTAEWRSADPTVVANDRTPEQVRINTAAATTFDSFASRFQALAKNSDSPVLADFALMVAQYFRAYAHALPTYTTSDSYLAEVGTSTIAIIKFGCLSAG